MNRKILAKLLAAILAFILTFANISILGIYVNESIALSINLEEQDTSVENASIEFDAYFKENGEINHSKDIDLNNPDNIYFKIYISNGYLKNGIISINDLIFDLADGEIENPCVQKVETDRIILNQINKNENIELELPLYFYADDDFNINKVNMVANVVLEGIYVNSSGNEINISKTIQINPQITSETRTNVEAEVTTYSSTINEGVLLQTTIESNLENYLLPIKKTEIEIEIPKINDIEPSKISLYANSTKATNGKAERVFKINQDYIIKDDNGTKKIVLTINNEPNENGIVSWMKSEKDEIIVIFKYGEDAVLEEANIKINITDKIEAYDSKNSIYENNISESLLLSENIGGNYKFSTSFKESELYKGYMLVEGADLTPFTEFWKIDIADIDKADNIIFDKISAKDYYIDANEEVKLTDKIVFVSTKISKDNFMDILGENGFITIYDETNVVATLDKDNLEYTYTQEIKNIKIVTSKPISEGRIIIENKRGIQSGQSNAINLKKIRATIRGGVKEGENEISTSEIGYELFLRNPTTNADITIDKQSLSLTQPTSVEILIELKTNDNTCNLYKNPKITIEFPKYIKSIKNVTIPEPLYMQGLTLIEHNIRINESGNIMVDMNLSGEQTEFNTSTVSEGAIIVLQADIEVDELAPKVEDQIRAYILNYNEINLEENTPIMLGTLITYSQEETMITRSIISGLDEEVKALKEAKTKIIEADAESRTITIRIDAVNSIEKEIKETKILGRIPFVGNKTVTTNEDLGSTFSTVMTSEIITVDGTNTNEVDIYYSENGEATKDLRSVENGWTNTPSDLSKIKSYLIVYKEEEMANGKKLSFSYNAEIPANVGVEKETYSTYGIYYKEDSELKIKEASKIGLVTTKNVLDTIMNNENISVSVVESSSGEILESGSTVKEGQYVDYEVTIMNKTNDEMTIDLEVAKENAVFYGAYAYDKMLFTEEKVYIKKELEDETLSETITIAAQSAYIYKYTLVVDSDAENKELKSTISVKQNDVKIINDIKVTNQIISALLKIRLEFNGIEGKPTYSRGVLPLIIYVENISDTKLNNVNIELKLPELLTYRYVSLYDNESTYDSKDTSTKNLKFTINSIDAGKNIKIYIQTDVGSIGISKEFEIIDLYATAVVNNEKFISNVVSTKINSAEIIVTADMTGNIQGEYVEDGDEIIYTIRIENKGNLDERYLKIEDTFPNVLNVQNYTIINNDGTNISKETSYNSFIQGDLELPAKSSVVLEIKTKVIESLAESDIITNKAIISGAFFDTFETNTVTYKLRRNQNNTDNPNNPDNPINSDNSDDPNNTTEETYKIKGTVWYDENSDGKKDLDEKKLGGINVLLLNNNTSEFIKNTDGKTKVVVTNDDGTYEFKNISSGEYVVVFMYDVKEYKTTIYQKKDVSADKNSDAIDKEIGINGIKTKVAVTDILTIGKTDKENIDLGLIDLKVFDLKLEKEIKTVIVQNKQGVETYKFSNGKTAKIEIPSKYMKGTTLTIEYNIRVTNEGDIKGKVTKIIDYLPKDLDFSSEINLEWYKGTDGNLYTEELKNIEIEPGEAKEVTLVLTKIIKEEAAEVINNTAEIAESYNTEGKKDSDSIAKNNAQGEDDLSYADLIVTIKTGIGEYTLIVTEIVIIIGMLASGVYLIKTKVLSR